MPGHAYWGAALSAVECLPAWLAHSRTCRVVMSRPPADHSAPRFPPPAPPGVRLYVVFGYEVGFGERGPVAGLGTVRAPSLAAARELGAALARSRGVGASPLYVVRTWRASATAGWPAR